MICFPKLIRNQISVSLSWKFLSVSRAYICFPKKKFNPFSMQCHLFENRYLFSNLLSHLLETIICFPIFREKAISWKGETYILEKQLRWLLLKHEGFNFCQSQVLHWKSLKMRFYAKGVYNLRASNGIIRKFWIENKLREASKE